MASDRNSPCACKSGKKYKHCCAVASPRSSHRLAAVLLILFVAAAAWGMIGVARRAISADVGTASQTVASRPPGPAPPGKEWSYEHGHWHDIESAAIPPPAGPVPPGKVWSAEHGHWHDLDGGEPLPTQFAPEPEAVEAVTDSEVSYTE